VKLGSAADAVVVAWSARARPIAQPGDAGGGWIWLCGAPLADDDVVTATLAGAYDAVSITEAGWAGRVAARLAELDERAPALPETPGFVSGSAASRAVLSQLWRASRTSMPVLLTGETGTGKDLAARLVHDWSERRRARFVVINCAAIPNDLIESELFGYTRGAFCGAAHDYDGQLVAAGGGTVFLDEIDDTPPTLQVKLLRVLEDKVVSRLGENVWRKLDFRVIAATNRDLGKLIHSGEFGPDLYERLAIVAITLPPLRERKEELPALLEHMIARFYTEEPAAASRGRVDAVSPRALAMLAAYDWPGNVRELRNVVFEALVHKRGGREILVSDLPRRVLRRESQQPRTPDLIDRVSIENCIAAGKMNLRAEIDRLEREALSIALGRAGWNAVRTAALLGEVGRGASSDPAGTVRAMIRRLGLRRGML
jgi:DNA-binding NtrC family response regulator